MPAGKIELDGIWVPLNFRAVGGGMIPVEFKLDTGFDGFLLHNDIRWVTENIIAEYIGHEPDALISACGNTIGVYYYHVYINAHGRERKVVLSVPSGNSGIRRPLMGMEYLDPAGISFIGTHAWGFL